jgi:hypothetical protein
MAEFKAKVTIKAIKEQSAPAEKCKKIVLWTGNFLPNLEEL